MRPGLLPPAGSRWPSGDEQCVGILHLEPVELAGRYAIPFQSSLDDLDYHEWAVVRLASGRPVKLIRYLRSPGQGTDVWIDAEDDPASARREFLEALGLGADALAWTNDEPIDPEQREYRRAEITR